jgi:dolichol-phosphate mannosyltransferase
LEEDRMSRVRVLVAMPVYNEAAHLVTVLRQVKPYGHDLLVVNDGSTDETPELLAREPGIQVLTHPTNMGYGRALADAFDYALANCYDATITMDCDGQHEPGAIPQFLTRLQDADIVSGSRYLSEFDTDDAAPSERRRINAEITRLLNGWFGFGISDAFCGFKAYSSKALENFDITEDGYAMPLQLWVQAYAAGLDVIEVAIPRIYRDHSRTFGGGLDEAEKRMKYYMKVLERELERLSLVSAPRCATKCGGSA